MGFVAAARSDFRGEVVKLEDVWVAYSGADKPAIRGISLKLPLHKTVLVTGPNGAGKTTLIETCLGLLKPFKGRAELFGVDTRYRGVVKVRKLCSYVPQNFMKPPYEAYTVGHVLKLGLASFKSAFEPVNGGEEERIRWAAELLQIEDLLNKPIGELSGGQQQRVLIARALLRKPRALFLDEPFASLDKEGRLVIAEAVREYVRREDASAVVVSHDVAPLNGISDITLRLVDGAVVEYEGIAL